MDKMTGGAEPKTGGMKCKCPHHSVVPFLIVLLGLLFLLNALGAVGDRFTEVTWPILVLLAGGSALMESKCKCC